MKNLTSTSEFDSVIKSLYGVVSKTKFRRLSNMLLLLHKSDSSKCTVTRMAMNLNVERRTVYRYIADLSNEVVVDNGFIYLRHLAMAA